MDDADTDTDTDTDTFRRGAELFARLAPDGAAPPWETFDDVAPLLGRQTAYAFGAIVSRPGLDLRTREIATVCMLAVLGGSEPQVAFHTGAALRAGATAPEVVEALTQVSIYAGIPRALNAVAAARQAFIEYGVSAIEPAPRTVVTEFLHLLEQGDPSAAAGMLADDVIVTLPGAHAGMPWAGTWSGSDGVRALQSAVADKTGLEQVEFGDPVSTRDTVFAAGSVGHRLVGHRRADFVLELVVAHGQITRVRLHGDGVGVVVADPVVVGGALTR